MVTRALTVTYSIIVVYLRPQEYDKNHTRLTVGGDCIDYPWGVSTPTSDLTTTKILFNSTISTPGATLVTMDIKNFYLNTPLSRYEYMHMKLESLTDKIIKEYGLRELATNGWVYIDIHKVMYGLPQAGLLSNKWLTKRLDKKGYYPCQHTPGMCHHV